MRTFEAYKMHKRQTFRLGAVLWLLAMSGVLVLTFTLLPQFLAKVESALPLWAILSISIIQSAVLVAGAASIGVILAPPLGLRAPALEARMSGGAFWGNLKPQLAVAGAAGLAVAGLLLILQHVTPTELETQTQDVQVALAAKLLYGGITEEVLMRWGVMTLMAWIFWRLAGKRETALAASIVLAIVLSALLFGVGHLPAVKAMGATLSAPVVVYVLLGNLLPGVLFGVLYWRRGLEAAMVAHALAHFVFTVVSG